jgi:hypothetical protein
MAMTRITLRLPDGVTYGRTVHSIPRKGELVRIMDDPFRVADVEYTVIPAFQDGYYSVNIWLESA